MKKAYTIVLAAMLVFAAACSKEAPQTPDNGHETTRLTFTLSGANGVIDTYSGITTVPGNGFEKTVTDITVYLFDHAADGSGVLRVVREFDNLTLTNGKVMLTMDVDASMTGQYTAYFIANNADGQFLDLSNPYGDGVAVQVGSTTEDFFVNMPAKAFTDVPTGSFLITGRTDTPFAAYGDHAVTLRNRVARFDVVNKHPHLTVTKVTIRAAADRSTVFGDATRDPAAQVINPADITAFSWADYEAGGTVVGQVAESAFFLHPTTIPTVTKLYVEGYIGTLGVDDETFVYEVDSEPIGIRANYRYIVTVAEAEPITVGLAGEWDTDNNTTTASAMPLQLASIGAGTSLFNPTTMTLDLQGTVNFRLVTSKPNGPDYDFIPVPGDPAYFEEFDTDDFEVLEYKTEQTITYAESYYTTYFRFKVKAAPPTGKSYVSILRFSDGGQHPLDILIYFVDTRTVPTGFYPDGFYPGSTMPWVEVGGVAWAPVNAGAETADGQGLFAQWSRTVGFRGGATSDVVTGPLPFLAFYNTQNPLNPVQMRHQPFIVNRTGDGIGDWLTAGDAYTDYRNGLWNYAEGSYSGSPCPAGWQIPTAAQMQTLIDAYTANKYTDNGTGITFTGDDGVSQLTLPYVGYLDSTDGKLYAAGTAGRYWSADMDGTQSTALSLGGTGVSQDAYPRAMGFSLRCVKE